MCAIFPAFERSARAWSKRYGRAVARHPLRFVLLGLLVALACGAGLVSLDASLEDQTNYWVPRSSRAWKDRGTLLDLYDDVQGRGNTALILRTRSAAQSITTQANLDTAFRIFHHITTEATSGGRSFPDACLLDRTASACTVLSLFAALNITSADDVDEGQVLAALQSGQVDPDSFFGEITRDENGTFQSARMMGMVFALDMPANDASKRDANYPFLEVIDDYLGEVDGSSHLDMGWYSVSFENAELSRTVAGEVPLVFGSALIIFLLLMVVLGGRPPRKSRLLLGSVIVLVVLLDLAIVFGLCGWFGLPLTVISTLMAFVMLGIGVDDIIIMTRSLDSESHVPDLEDAMGSAMERAGFPIFTTSWSSFVAFLSGSFIDIPAIAWFCLSGVFGVLGIFFLTLTVFAGFLVLDEKRRRAHRFDCLVCCGSPSPVGGSKAGDGVNGQELKERASRRSKQVPPDPEPPKTAHSGSLTARLLMGVADGVTHPKFGWLVCLLIVAGFLAMFGSAFVGATNDPDTTMSVVELFPDDSPIANYYEWNSRVTLGGDTAYVVVQREDYADAEVQAKLLGALDAVKAEDGVVFPPFTCWLCALGDFANATGRSDELVGDGFYGLLHDFLATPQFTFVDNDGIEQTDNGTAYSTDLRFQNGEIAASRFLVRFRPAADMSATVDAVESVRDAVKSRFDNGLVWADYFGYADREAGSLDVIKRTLVMTASATTLAMFLVLHPGLALLLSAGVVLIDVDIIGFAVWWGVALDGIALTCTIMAVGLSIDYLIHIGHAFLTEHGTAEARLRSAFSHMGASVLLGGVTTFAGVCLTGAAKSAAFRTFFKLLFLTTSLGVVHGLFLAPVLLYAAFALYERLSRGRSGER